MKMWRFVSVRALCLISMASFGAFVAPFSAFAQSDNASISGFVKDASGAVVPGVKITVKNDISRNGTRASFRVKSAICC